MTSYEVLANVPITMRDPVSGFVKGRKITIRTNEGTVGIIEVPDTATVDEVNAAKMAEAERLNALNGPG